MITVVRINFGDEDKRMFKKRTGVPPTRDNIKREALKLLDNMLYPDGRPKAKKQKFVVSR
jgi:hypothetical protein